MVKHILRVTQPLDVAFFPVGDSASRHSIGSCELHTVRADVGVVVVQNRWRRAAGVIPVDADTVTIVVVLGDVLSGERKDEVEWG